jgi:dephospho-CoA kinase
MCDLLRPFVPYFRHGATALRCSGECVKRALASPAAPTQNAAMRLWGLTGGIASGKSSVRAYFSALGAACIDADALYHTLLLPAAAGQPSVLSQQIADALGADLLRPDGSLDRPALARRAFKDPALRQQLEAITHPAVRQSAATALAELSAVGHQEVIYDVPLLFETGLDRQLSGTLVVWVPGDIQRQRLRQRDGLDPEAVELRIAAQHSLDDKKQRATFVIDNSGTPEQTQGHTAEVWEKMRQSALPSLPKNRAK